MKPTVSGGEVASTTAPPLVITTASFMGLGLHEWVYVATLTYTVMQIGRLVWRGYHAWKESQDG